MGYGYRRPRPAAQAASRLPAVILFLAVGLFIVADLIFGLDFNWVDYAIVIIIALFGLKGYIRGLINTVFSLAGYLLGMILAYVFSSRLAHIAMEKTGIGEAIGNRIEKIIPAISQLPAISTDQAKSYLDFIEKNPQLNQAISDSPFMNQLMAITNSAANAGPEYQDTIVTMNDMLTFTIVKVLAIIVIFIVVKLLVVLIGKILTSVMNSSTVLGTANRTGGMALGLGAGIIVTCLVFAIVIPFIGSLGIVKLPDPFSDSIVMGWLSKLMMALIGAG
ncbi:MAG TPA: CvpA family protein [Thermoclostridium sp.]|mgnify:FL=1|nr:CvpA family protein [Thermoclostridium sp.]HPU44980.1 CvpA family protein [Thermoclostridium sp.]